MRTSHPMSTLRPATAARLALAGALAALALGLLAPAASALPNDSGGALLGDDGSVYLAVAGRYDQLFPQGTETYPDHRVLALEILASNGDRSRLLVPGTEGHEIDGLPRLIYESSSDTIYLVWESRNSAAASRIQMVSYRSPAAADSRWTEPIEISGDVGRLKGAPKVEATADTYRMPTAEGDSRVMRRTVLHVVWWEEGDRAKDQVFYTPVVIDRGRYLGRNPVISLADLDPGSVRPAGEMMGAHLGPVLAELARSPVLVPGRDRHSAAIGMVNAGTTTLLGIEVRLLPGELGLMAERIQMRVRQLGEVAPGADRLEAIRGIIRSQIIEIGRDLNPGLLRHLTGQVLLQLERVVREQPDLPLEALAGIIRSQIIEIGSDLFASADGPQSERQRIVVEIPSGRTFPHLVRLSLAKASSAPSPGGGATPELYVSSTGERLLLSWTDGEGRLLWSETVSAAPTGAAGGAAQQGASAWSEPRSLQLGQGADAPRADEVLSRRVQRPE